MTVELAIYPKQFRNVDTAAVSTNGRGQYAPLKTMSPTYYVRTVNTSVYESGNKDTQQKGQS